MIDTRRIDFDVPIYNVPVTVIVGDKDAAIDFLREKMNQLEFEETKKTILGCEGYALSADTGGGCHKFIWVGDIDNTKILMHECLHVAFYILDYFGVPANPQSQEAVAYMQGYLYEEIVKRHKTAKPPKSHKKRYEKSKLLDKQTDGLNRSASFSALRSAMVKS